MDERAKDHTRREWRELGFFYACDDGAREWRLAGSRAGLLGFSRILRAYVADPRNGVVSEHEHYGPYLSLEIMTSTDTGLNGHAIHGPLTELERLAFLVEHKLVAQVPGARICIREEFAPTSEFTLVLELHSDEFDPASADAELV